MYLRAPLKAMLMKRHQSTPRFLGGGWGKRWFEVDDQFYVLFCFKSLLDQQRRTPSRVYALAEFSKIEEGEGNTMALAFEPDATGERPPLCLTAQSHALTERWVRGISMRLRLIQADNKADARRTPRTVRLTVKKPANLPAPRLTSPTPCDAGDGADTSEAKESSSPSGPDQRPSSTRIGVMLTNVPDCPIGVMISVIFDGMLAQAAGLRVGDIIIAVGGHACLSHPHGGWLINEGMQTGTLELIVRQRGAADKLASLNSRITVLEDQSSCLLPSPRPLSPSPVS